MKRILWSGVAAFGWLVGLACGPAAAQPPLGRPPTNPPSRPPGSPFTNLFRGGTNPAINYYGLVRPQQEFRSDLTQLQQQRLQAGALLTLPDQGVSTIPTTGHPTRFFNYSHYFLNQGGGQLNATPGTLLGTPTFTPRPQLGAPPVTPSTSSTAVTPYFLVRYGSDGPGNALRLL